MEDGTLMLLKNCIQHETIAKRTTTSTLIPIKSVRRISPTVIEYVQLRFKVRNSLNIS
jgi:hypothetical protein